MTCQLNGKIVIRKGVFETNSSSMHSITISDKSGLMEILNLASDGITLKVDCDYDFQWGEVTYTDAAAKLAYCIADGVNIEMLERVLKAQTGAQVIEYTGEDGTIDNQSTGTAVNEAHTDKLLRDFIFNTESELVIDNDNH